MSVVEKLDNYRNLPTSRGNFESQESEYSYWVDDIEGKIPDNFSGTFFRNGPGRLKIGNDELLNWFDADGMIARTTFVNGKAHFCNQFVRTPKYIDETAAGKMLYRGFGGAPKGSFLKRFSPPANPANTGLILHGGKFLALNEGGRPFEVDPATLDTVGEYNYHNQLTTNNLFSAHGKVNPHTGCYYNFGMSFEFSLKGLKPGFDFYKISPSGKLVDRQKFALDFMPLLHDFAMTENYAIFIQSSVAMPDNLLKLMLSGESMADAMMFDASRTSKLIIVNLHTMRLVDEIEIEPLAALHFGNAYEKHGEIHFDMMETKASAYNTPAIKKQPLNIYDPNVDLREGAGIYTRFVINLRQGLAIKEPLTDALEGEFPQWNWAQTTAENRYAISAAYPVDSSGSYFGAVQMIDRQTGKVDIHDFGDYRYTGEPLMVTKPDARSQDDFYVMSYVYNGNENRSEIVLLDSQNFSDEIAVVKLRHHLPQGFHGLFTHKTFI